jgi:pyruvate,water dikinase
MNLVLSLRCPEALDPRTTGGKGAALAALVAAGFSVPEGFVVVADAYARFAAAGDGAAADLASRAVPAEVEAAVDAALATLDGDSFAVRSSSTLEDLQSAAFAGQHDTYLCVRRADVAKRVRDAWLSLGSERAIRYREERGFGRDEARMAVVVQEMVDARVAGVIFGLDPVSGALDEMVVDANFGLGETVVSGELSVDHFRLNRRTLEVLEARLGDKPHQLVAGDDGPAVAPTPHRGACLSPDELALLGRTAQRIEPARGARLDIEWAFDRTGALRVLQARPITAIPPRWTRQESAERFPSAMTPLAWELAEAGFHESLGASLALMGFPAFGGKWFSLFDGYVYGNQSAVDLVLGEAAPRLASTGDLRALAGGAADRFAWVLDLPERWPIALDGTLATLGALAAEPARQASPAACWARIGRIDAAGRAYFRPNIAISMGHGLLHRTLHAALALFFDRAEAARIYLALTRVADTKTGAVNRELLALAAAVRATPALHAAFAGGDRRALAEPGALAALDPRFAADFERFVAAHAHRETDPDPFQPPFGDAPWVVLDTLAALAAAEAPPDPRAEARRARADARRAEAALFARVPEDLHDFVAELVRLARLYTELDDWEHYETTRLHLLFRRGLFAFGAWLSEAGIAAQPEDAFFAERAAIEAWLGAPTDASAAALRRSMVEGRAAYEAQRLRTPPFELGRAAVEPALAGDLSGLPGSPGVAVGEVFVVRSAADFGSFPRGAVLVAPSTNPAWTPLFYGAAAVVTESGGPLSHGAVTARELGLPCVMAVRGATSALVTGQRVRVDGARGVVARVDAAA